jgi:UDP-N-acetylmuramate dehydrogenase
MMKDLEDQQRHRVHMSDITWLKVGGDALTFTPRDGDELSYFLCHNEKPYLVMGAGSNILSRDKGIDETVIRMHKAFRTFQVSDDTVEVGASLLDRYVAERCQILGLSGLEFLYTIPGAIGGGLAMNAGCYGSDFSDRLVCVWMMDDKGVVHKVLPDELKYGYRTCFFPHGWIFIKARFRIVQSDPTAVALTMRSFYQKREQDQPSGVLTGGSTFMNPKNQKAWILIDQAGYRGRQKGQACIDEKHCNFLVNKGGSTASDLEDLAEEARQAVYQKTGILLQWEIVCWGKK